MSTVDATVCSETEDESSEVLSGSSEPPPVANRFANVDQDGLKRVYHINAVDIVTQWELVACVERISEAYLLPVIAAPTGS